MFQALMMDANLAVTSLGLKQYRTNKQQCYLYYVHQKTTHTQTMNIHQ